MPHTHHANVSIFPWRTILLIAFILSPRRDALAVPGTSGIFDVRTFGATGDGRAIVTSAINQAIEAASAAGGGTVLFPAGSYRSFSIHLKSNVTLDLKPGSWLIAADVGEQAAYDAPEPNSPADKYEDFGHSHWHNSLICGEDLENVSIVGTGVIFGKGLSRGTRGWALGEGGRPTTRPSSKPASQAAVTPTTRPTSRSGGETYPNPTDTLADGIGNKSIALKNCRNVTLRDFVILHGGHFGILATGVDNLTIDNLKIDTNRDGMDIDCCRNVRVANCSVNSPWDDAICLKSCYGLGAIRPTENVTIANCFVTGGYDEGTLFDATFKRSAADYRSSRNGRIKFGTESNGGFKNITVSNCVMENCRGLAIESVDGGIIEDVVIDNIAMRDITLSPIFIRLGARLRGPDNPPVGIIRRVILSNIIASNVRGGLGPILSGIPGHPIEEVRIHDVVIQSQGGGTAREAGITPPENEAGYPESGMFGKLPAYGFFIRHAAGIEMHHVELRLIDPDQRPAMVLDDVAGAEIEHFKAARMGDVPVIRIHQVADFTVQSCSGIPDARRESGSEESF